MRCFDTILVSMDVFRESVTLYAVLRDYPEAINDVPNWGWLSAGGEKCKGICFCRGMEHK